MRDVSLYFFILPSIFVQAFLPSKPFSLSSHSRMLHNIQSRQFLSAADSSNGMALDIGAYIIALSFGALYSSDLHYLISLPLIIHPVVVSTKTLSSENFLKHFCDQNNYVMKSSTVDNLDTINSQKKAIIVVDAGSITDKNSDDLQKVSTMPY
jgi:hypothetical protein